MKRFLNPAEEFGGDRRKGEGEDEKITKGEEGKEGPKHGPSSKVPLLDPPIIINDYILMILL